MQPAHIRSAKSVAGLSGAPASTGLVPQSPQIPRKSMSMQKTSFAGDRLSLCARCHARFSSGARHVCKAVSRTHGASAHIAAVREPIRQILAKDDDILDGEVVEERQELERMWNMNSYDSSREKTNLVIDEAESFARKANEAIKELGDLPGLLDEMQALSSALQESASKKKSRSERGEARAARRASRKASAALSDSVATKALGRPKSRATASRATTSTVPSQKALTTDMVSSNRQTSPPSTSSEASSQSSNKFASVRNHRGKQWGRAGVVVRTLAKAGSTGPDKGMSNLMRNMNHSRLLSQDDEKTLMTRVQGFLKLERKYQAFKDAMEQQGTQPLWEDFAATFGTHVNPDELQALFEEGKACKHAMVQANLRLVISVAKKYVGKGVSLQDLVSEGISGLTRATEKFDHTKGFKFSTYAHWWIRQSMTRAIGEQSRVVRLPQHLSDLASSVMRLRADMTERYQREPTDLELATEAGISLKRLSQLMLAYKSPVSLNAPAGTGQDATALEDMIEDQNSPSVEDVVAMESLKEDMERVLQTLPPREASVLRMRYGLDTGKETTLEEVGLCFNVTRERIRQLEVKALRRLRVNATRDGAAACLTEYDEETLHSVALPMRADSRAR